LGFICRRRSTSGDHPKKDLALMGQASYWKTIESLAQFFFNKKNP